MPKYAEIVQDSSSLWVGVWVEKLSCALDPAESLSPSATACGAEAWRSHLPHRILTCSGQRLARATVLGPSGSTITKINKEMSPKSPCDAFRFLEEAKRNDSTTRFAVRFVEVADPSSLPTTLRLRGSQSSFLVRHRVY